MGVPSSDPGTSHVDVERSFSEREPANQPASRAATAPQHSGPTGRPISPSHESRVGRTVPTVWWRRLINWVTNADMIFARLTIRVDQTPSAAARNRYCEGWEKELSAHSYKKKQTPDVVSEAFCQPVALLCTIRSRASYELRIPEWIFGACLEMSSFHF